MYVCIYLFMYQKHDIIYIYIYVYIQVYMFIAYTHTCPTIRLCIDKALSRSEQGNDNGDVEFLLC